MIREPKRKPPNGGVGVEGAQDPPWLPIRLETRLDAARAGLLVWMAAEEAAEYLGESASRFRDAASKGEIDRYKDIGSYRYHRDDLDRWRRQRGPKAC